MATTGGVVDAYGLETWAYVDEQRGYEWTILWSQMGVRCGSTWICVMGKHGQTM